MQGIYWAIGTATGNGNINPTTNAGKFLQNALSVLGVLGLALPAGVIGACRGRGGITVVTHDVDYQYYPSLIVTSLFLCLCRCLVIGTVLTCLALSCLALSGPVLSVLSCPVCLVLSVLSCLA